MIKVLLLGGSGFLGFNFKKLFKKKIKILDPTKKKLNLLNKKDIDKYFKNIKEVDFILNLSVYQQTGNYLVKNSNLIKKKNKIINQNIIYLWSKYLSKSKLISIGANCAYSKFKSNFSYTKGKLYGATKDFATEKRNFAKKCENLKKNRRMRYLIIVPGTLIGTGEQLNIKKMHFFNGALFRAAMFKNKKINKFNFIMNHDVIRELSNVNNVCYELFNNFNNKKSGVINLISDFRISLSQFYKLIEKRLSIKRKGNYEKSLFVATVNKSYKISVKHDLTKKDFINNKLFLSIFDNTFKEFLSKTKK